MIKANELRIGNFVTAIRCDNSQIIDQVKQLHESYVMTKFDWDKVEPIPLDEEWLLKFGIKLNKSFYNYEFEIEKWKDEFIMTISFNHESGGFVIGLKHVHQLQNLYFALTGTELTTKNKTK